MVYKKKGCFKINKKEVIILLMAAALLSSTAVFVFYSYYVVYDIKEMDMHLKVSDRYGINADTDKIYFGRLPPLGVSEREIHLHHKYSKPLKVSIISMNSLSAWVTVSENNFILPPNQNKTVKLSVSPPAYTEFGDYEGHLRVFFKRI